MASISAATPATYGLAMLVPVIAVHRSSGPANALAAMMSVPGAAISGLLRLSRDGPWLLVMWIRSWASSRFATDSTRLPHARELTDVLWTFERSVKNDGKLHASRLPMRPICRGSSRSIQPSKDPSRTSSPNSRTVQTPRSEEHTSELQSRENLVCRLLLE